MATVLLVDDDDGIRDLLRRYAEHFGLHVVAEAGDGREAVELAARLAPDVIVLDQQMPDMTGLEAMPRMREGSPDALIVLYSSYSDEHRQAALALGARACISKVESPRTVIRTVVDLLNEGKPGAA
ncbi:MAG TPA: response regulator transcription factor [Solirubrobacteraceae bacterium]|nr:response regulator transcription factor [Solirubrobacteraceae bacterium]